MTNMTPYSNFSSYLRGLYRALDERDRLAKAGEDYTDLNHKLASLAGTLALGDPRLLPEEKRVHSPPAQHRGLHVRRRLHPHGPRR